MKRCPECRRDYYDETLIYCLDDGSALLNGPGSLDPPTQRIPLRDSADQNTITSADTRLYTSGTALETKRSPYVPLVIGAGILVLLVGSVYGLYRFLLGQNAAAPPRPPGSITTQRLTGDGKARGAIISPDGKLIAYIRTEGSEHSIWIKQIQTDSAIQIVKPGELDRFDGMAFSPDGIF